MGLLYSFCAGEAHEICEAKMLGYMCAKAPQYIFFIHLPTDYA
jgi:hypothetical protein